MLKRYSILAILALCSLENQAFASAFSGEREIPGGRTMRSAPGVYRVSAANSTYDEVMGIILSGSPGVLFDRTVSKQDPDGRIGRKRIIVTRKDDGFIKFKTSHIDRAPGLLRTSSNKVTFRFPFGERASECIRELLSGLNSDGSDEEDTSSVHDQVEQGQMGYMQTPPGGETGTDTNRRRVDELLQVTDSEGSDDAAADATSPASRVSAPPARSARRAGRRRARGRYAESPLDQMPLSPEESSDIASLRAQLARLRAASRS